MQDKNLSAKNKSQVGRRSSGKDWEAREYCRFSGVPSATWFRKSHRDGHTSDTPCSALPRPNQGDENPERNGNDPKIQAMRREREIANKQTPRY